MQVESDNHCYFQPFWNMLGRIFIAIAIMVSNILISVVITRSSIHREEPSFIYINCLAIADMLTGLGLLLLCTGNILKLTCSISFCAVTLSVLGVSLQASFLLHTAVSIERFVCIVYPLRHSTWVTKKRVWLSIAGVAGCVFTFQSLNTTFYILDNVREMSCLHDKGQYGMFNFILSVTLCSIVYTVPTYCYCRIVKTALHQHRAIAAQILPGTIYKHETGVGM